MTKLVLLLAAILAVKRGLVITSASFKENGMIPKVFTCDGSNNSPALHLATIPEGTKSLAIIMHDPDAPMQGGFTHWVAWNLDPVKDIPANFKGGIQGQNGAGEPGYIGPCPPSGTHHYHFMIYALDTKLTLDKTTGKAGLEEAMKGHILQQGDLVGLYKKENSK
jgi:Raf kinase inhibitor-like YbhB/YbcL family protein